MKANKRHRTRSKPKYTLGIIKYKYYFVIFIVLLLLTALLFFYNLFSQRNIEINELSGSIRGSEGDLIADIVLGKDNFGEGMPGEVVPFKVMNPGGVLVDRLSKPDKVFIYDGANSRILGYSSLGVCENNTKKVCTTNLDCYKSSCKIQVGGQLGEKLPDIVFGQQDFNHSGCNGDSNYQSYPNRTPASNKTLCSMPESQVSTTEGGSYSSMSVDKVGSLFVADFDNNRVLKYEKPFTTDTIADEVWGQANFTENNCNRISGDLAKASSKPKDNTFCFRSYLNQGFTAGTDIDLLGNLWVADNGNNRVLRFPRKMSGISKNANLVLGQKDFVTNKEGSNLNQMRAPASVRVNPLNGRVYVADSWNNRVLYFDPPYSNGMNATGVFGSDLKYPTGIEFDTREMGIWVNDTGNNQLVLFTPEGKVKKVLFKDIFHADGACGSTTANYNTGCINPQKDPITGRSSCWANMCTVTGGIGVDTEGNVYAGGPNFMQDVWRFSAPIPSPTEGKVYSASSRFFNPPDKSNFIYGDKGFDSPRGVAVTNEQLIVADTSRLMFWNTSDPMEDLSNNNPADGVAGIDSFDSKTDATFSRISAEEDIRLWVTKYYWPSVEVYNLPLTLGAKPIKTLFKPGSSIPLLGGGELIFDNKLVENVFMDLDISSDGKFLWLVQQRKHRIIRIRNPLTNPVVDVILGQKNSSDELCNQGDPDFKEGAGYSSTLPFNYLCHPGSIAVDKEGNLFVSDHGLEVAGNFRVLVFLKKDNLFLSDPESLTSVLYEPQANKEIPNIATFDPSFNSKNQMVVGYNAYRDSRFPGLYTDPLNDSRPSTYIKDYFSMPYNSYFDNKDNLYITDLNRGRVLIYKNPDLSD